MDGDLSTGHLGLETWYCDECVLVDDASWYDFGIWDFVSYELDFDQVWDQGTLTEQIRDGIIRLNN